MQHPLIPERKVGWWQIVPWQSAVRLTQCGKTCPLSTRLQSVWELKQSLLIVDHMKIIDVGSHLWAALLADAVSWREGKSFTSIRHPGQLYVMITNFFLCTCESQWDFFFFPPHQMFKAAARCRSADVAGAKLLRHHRLLAFTGISERQLICQ